MKNYLKQQLNKLSEIKKELKPLFSLSQLSKTRVVLNSPPPPPRTNGAAQLWRFHFPQQTQLLVCALDIVNRKIPAENELEPLITSVNLKPLHVLFGFTQQWAKQVFVCYFLYVRYEIVFDRNCLGTRTKVSRGMSLFGRWSKIQISHE